MSLKHGLLGLLNYGSMTGYDLSKAFKQSLNFFWPAQSSQIYRELNGMEKQGWLTSEVEIQTEKPNRRVYAITPAGREVFMAWLAQAPEAGEIQFIKSQFLMRTFFLAERSIADNLAFFESFRGICQGAVQQLEGVQQSIQSYGQMLKSDTKALYWGMTRNFGLAYYRFCAAWAQQCIQALQEVEK